MDNSGIFKSAPQTMVWPMGSLPYVLSNLREGRYVHQDDMCIKRASDDTYYLMYVPSHDAVHLYEEWEGLFLNTMNDLKVKELLANDWLWTFIPQDKNDLLHQKEEEELRVKIQNYHTLVELGLLTFDEFLTVTTQLQEDFACRWPK